MLFSAHLAALTLIFIENLIKVSKLKQDRSIRSRKKQDDFYLNKMELLQSQAPAETELLGNSAVRTLNIRV